MFYPHLDDISTSHFHDNYLYFTIKNVEMVIFATSNGIFTTYLEIHNKIVCMMKTRNQTEEVKET
ncbi:hypothetical protein B4U37_03960 [Sutcliffiella horikoshii]|uniref:Uncharacterized protein n=1 Tax=Sutcliffiella horikoshii TaxID=79883 RepID=A0ABM6KFH3_9BACI|nr:hypothetical protein B4U37_03960 [Sutcliffiella horikoshii]